MQPAPALRVAVPVDAGDRAAAAVEIERVAVDVHAAGERGGRRGHHLRAGQRLAGPRPAGERVERTAAVLVGEVPAQSTGLAAEQVGCVAGTDVEGTEALAHRRLAGAEQRGPAV